MLADVFAVGDMLSQPFMRNAFVAGTAIALASGLVGYFLVLRSQVFSADALSHVTFTGALAALAFGVDVRVGLFASVIAVAVLLSVLAREGRADDVVVGSVFVWILGLGVLFLSLFTASRAASNSAGGVAALFGSIFGLDDSAVLTALVVGAIVSAAMLTMARPLLFASLDEGVALAQGVRVRAISVAFLLAVGLTAAEAAQAVGALLLLGLLATPGAAALRLTSRPFRAFLLSAALAVGCTWLGLIASYHVPKLPPSFSIVAALTAAYVGAVVVDHLRRSWRFGRPAL
ncbi:MAG TPA: metal ABC transporter permease [Acidimicrobiales bacterium]|nr:metal ABC transporter permease [Acidimicrobiales bacterium]